MKTVIIDGVEYELKPVIKVAKIENILDDYNSFTPTTNVEIIAGDIEVKDAVGTESNYRKKYVDGTLTPADLPRRETKMTPKPQLEGFFNGGEEYFVGEGIQTYY